MNEKRSAAVGGSAPNSGKGSGMESGNPLYDFSTLPGWRQARIAKHLGYGRSAARTANELASEMGVYRREIGAAVQLERLAGISICASTDRQPRYYLPATLRELSRFQKSLQGRVSAIRNTLQAITRTLDGLTRRQEDERE